MDRTNELFTNQSAFAGAMASNPDLCIKVAQKALGIQLEPAIEDASKPSIDSNAKCVRFNAVVSMLGKVVPIKMRLHNFSSEDVEDNLIEVDAGTFGVMLNVPTDVAGLADLAA